MEFHDIFLEALECESSEELNAFLDRVCAGREDQRTEILRMLEIAGQSDDPFDSAVFCLPEVQATFFDSKALLQSQLGKRFQIDRQLGEGGMGTVWLAEQSAPLKRKVAIKLLRIGLESTLTLARFHKERDALANLQHPNIANIFDCGITREGRPFLVMEYCDGPSILEYCKTHSLSVKSRIELVIGVCRAISYIHGKGVLHRDIKPANVLVPEFEGLPTPKVIDFGLAKSFGAQDRQSSWHTLPGDLIGSPECMAPELLARQPDPPSQQSDVYSLGALIYVLIAGQPPYGWMNPNSNTVIDFLKRVAEKTSVTTQRVTQ